MINKLYYIQITCIKDIQFPNVEYHKGDVIYYNNNASSNETYIWNTYNQSSQIQENFNRYNTICKASHLPFVRTKNKAKKYKQENWANWIAELINKRGDFKAEVKEINLIYKEIEDNEETK